MGDTKLVKVDNWGAFFLQRLKHFFNRTDYCDLTLQFQDNAQLKVHRLVLNACTEYFELLERTCEMYEDCLIMPDDLQADVVVPIVNFMYTGQLEYKYELINRLHQTAQIMNMTVLTKLLDAHKLQPPKPQQKPAYKQLNNQSNYSRNSATKKQQPSTSTSKIKAPIKNDRLEVTEIPGIYGDPLVRMQQHRRKRNLLPARPTRYEVPEDLETSNLFENSFEEISYESQPLMTHPKNDYSSKSRYSYDAPSSSKKFDDYNNILKRPSMSTGEIEFKRLKSNEGNTLFSEAEEYAQNENCFEDPLDFESARQSQSQSASKQFDHVIEMEGAKVTIETKTGSDTPIDHAKIISEVLKKYPHLVKNNKNIKLKIINKPGKSATKIVTAKSTAQSKKTSPTQTQMTQRVIKKEIHKDYPYETDITDTKEIGKLISLGVENVKGPWLCLICGTPGKALIFPSYHKFRNHLVDVHNERPPSNMCEFCGLKSGKRNHLLHHIYTKHGVPPPPSYHFPKCNQCSYIALTEAFLVKHKMTHSELRNFSCNVCQISFKSSNQLLQHIQKTGHKICPDRRANLQCVYCMKNFLRESNLYAHLKSTHKAIARSDGIIDNSDEEDTIFNKTVNRVKSEPILEEPDHPSDISEEEEEEDYDDDEIEDSNEQYQIQTESGGIRVINKKNVNSPHKILNESISNPAQATKKAAMSHTTKAIHNVKQIHISEPTIVKKPNERIVVINNKEYVFKNPGVLEEHTENMENEFIISDMIDPETQSVENANVSISHTELPQLVSNPARNYPKVQSQVITKPNSINQPYQIVVSSDQEYKALIAANPSIIFQDDSEGKAMTVMSHNTQMETESIGIDSSQNSNMMIIQDDYPITVSETLTGDNSNIVVVYSNIGPQEIQYSGQQIVADQSIQEQLVQNSQVITTVSNNTLQQTMIVQQPIEQWQSQEQHAVMSVLEAPESIVTHESMQEEIETQPIVMPADNLVNNPTVVDKEMTNVAELQIIGQSEHTMGEVVVSQQAEELHETVIIDQNETIINTTEEEEQQITTEPQDEEIIISNNQNISEVEVENQEHMVSMETSTSIEEQIVEDPANDDTTEVGMESENSQELSENGSADQPLSEKIRDLAAEWSDDETLKVPENIESANIENVETNTTTETENNLSNNPEIEESIENIQEEMNNQLTSTQPSKKIIITSDITIPSAASITNSESLTSESVDPTSNLADPIEAQDNAQGPSENKISSLLNDWDDNDSQAESSDSKTPEKMLTEPEEKLKIVTATDDLAPQKEDSGKSLDKIISDWDEDEEEKEE